MLNDTRIAFGLILALVLAVCFNGSRVLAADMSPWTVGGGEYKYRQEITIDPSLTGSDLTGYPLPIQITDASNPLFANAIDGTDIVFTSDDKVTLLSKEIETYTTAGTPQLTAWVKTDISSSMDTKIYMYYNGPSVADSTATWDSSYKLVQHLQEDPSGAGPIILDSTSNGNNGTPSGAMTSGQQVAGQIGGALDFDGGDMVSLGTDSSLFPADVTVEAWAKLDIAVDPISTWYGVFTNKNGVNHGLNLEMSLAQGFGSLVGDGASGSYLETISSPSLTTPFPATTDDWYHLAVTHDSGTNLNTLYVDGVAVDTLSKVLAYSGTVQAQIGAFYASGSLKFNGIIDEVRLSDSVRSADWIAAQSLLVNNPDAYLSFAFQEGPVPEPSSLMLLGLGAMGLVRHTRRRRARA